MTISVPCGQCGVRVRVPRDAVGKKARCPRCQQTFVVPPPQAIPVTPTAVVATPVSTQLSCPSCQKPLPPEAKICVDCGFDLRTGTKLQTVIEKKKMTPRSTAATEPHPRASADSTATSVHADTFAFAEDDAPLERPAHVMRTCPDCGDEFPEQLVTCPLCAAEREKKRLLYLMPPGEGGEYPIGMCVAQCLWFGVGVLIVVPAMLFVLLLILARAVNSGLFGLVCCEAAFGVRVILTGMRTARGSARGVVSNGIGSIGFALLFFGAGIWLLFGQTALSGAALTFTVARLFFCGMGLLVAGVLAICSYRKYAAWAVGQHRNK